MYAFINQIFCTLTRADIAASTSAQYWIGGVRFGTGSNIGGGEFAFMFKRDIRNGNTGAVMTA
jgi:hypothetical protein